MIYDTISSGWVINSLLSCCLISKGITSNHKNNPIALHRIILMPIKTVRGDGIITIASISSHHNNTLSFFHRYVSLSIGLVYRVYMLYTGR